MDFFCINSVNINSIEFIRDPCFCIDSIDTYSTDSAVKKPSVSAFQNFFWIANWLNSKKLMSRNV